jgi:hypothetical protein
VIKCDVQSYAQSYVQSYVQPTYLTRNLQFTIIIMALSTSQGATLSNRARYAEDVGRRESKERFKEKALGRIRRIIVIRQHATRTHTPSVLFLLAFFSKPHERDERTSQARFECRGAAASSARGGGRGARGVGRRAAGGAFERWPKLRYRE